MNILTNNNFEAVTNSGVSLVDFYANWCGPCKMVLPIIDSLDEEFAGKANICKVDVDANGDIASKYNIKSVPTVLIMKDGEVVDTLVGMKSKAIYTEKLFGSIL